jgi:RimJ/RimL family protein N-acetyltransferase
VGEWVALMPDKPITRPDGKLSLGIVLRDQGKLIGFVQLYFPDPKLPIAGFTIILSPTFWGIGYGTESLRALLAFLISDLELHRVAASIDARNGRALQLLTAVGMRQEGRFLEDQYVKGEWIDTVYFAILRKEFEERCQKSLDAASSRVSWTHQH